MSFTHHVAAIGNAIVDVIAPADDAFLAAEGLPKGAMTLIDQGQAQDLYSRMAAGVETSGGSAGNTIAGVASLGGRAAYIGKVAADALGDIFAHDIRAVGAHYQTAPLAAGPATARCLVNVTPDGQRTMCTYLGACVELTADDVDPAVIEGAAIVYLEGYLFDPPEARRAFAKAAGLARAAGRRIALSLSDAFVVDRHREALLGFIDGQVDVLLANESEICSLFATDDFETAVAAASRLVPVCALTRGDHGSTALADGHRVDIPADAIEKLVDTTGAGDQYAAGFLFGLASGLDLKTCAELGSLAAAEVIGHYGPRPAVSLRQLAVAKGISLP